MKNNLKKLWYEMFFNVKSVINVLTVLLINRDVNLKNTISAVGK